MVQRLIDGEPTVDLLIGPNGGPLSWLTNIVIELARQIEKLGRALFEVLFGNLQRRFIKRPHIGHEYIENARDECERHDQKGKSPEPTRSAA